MKTVHAVLNTPFLRPATPCGNRRERVLAVEVETLDSARWHRSINCRRCLGATAVKQATETAADTRDPFAGLDPDTLYA